MALSSVAQEWTAPPKDQAEHINGSALFTCGLRHLDGRQIQWQQLHANNTVVKTLFYNDHNWTDSTRYTVHRHSSTAGVTGYDLRIADIERFDDKVYRCDVQGFEYRQAILTVLGEFILKKSKRVWK